eukprot:GHRQ01011939.1.p1 GENE.GHRQ01011939.1~~GHRQ01011939.1.p1  ORF type:complete len:216 (+),score=65.04 GHRQ01011939.1:243-890(+)
MHLTARRAGAAHTTFATVAVVWLCMCVSQAVLQCLSVAFNTFWCCASTAVAISKCTHITCRGSARIVCDVAPGGRAAGVVKGPLMLELGVSPDVAAATSATMILFTAASACVVYSRFGQILADYGAVLVAFGFCTTLVSQLLTFVLIKLIGRRSVIVFMMVTLMSSACAIMFVQSGFMTRELVLNPSELSHFGRLCPKDSQGLGHLLQQLLRQIQ